MVLFKYSDEEIPNNVKKIYIPLWSYSNCPASTPLTLKFSNLHSTMVLFKSLPFFKIPPCANRFTFHYGPIQISSWGISPQLFNNLHSTMVLFKSVAIAIQ